MDEDDARRWIEDVLIALMRLTDRNGLKVVLGPDHQIAVLAGAITAINNRRDDVGLFRPLRVSLGDLVHGDSDG